MLLRSKGQAEFPLDLDLEKTLRRAKKNHQFEQSSNMEQEGERIEQVHQVPVASRRRFGGLFEATFEQAPVVYEANGDHYQIPPAMINLVQ